MSNSAMNSQVSDYQRFLSEEARQTMGSLNSARGQPSDYEIRERAMGVALQVANATGCEVMPLAKEVYDWLKAAE